MDVLTISGSPDRQIFTAKRYGFSQSGLRNVASFTIE
jgi:hypothetical protein